MQPPVVSALVAEVRGGSDVAQEPRKRRDLVRQHRGRSAPAREPFLRTLPRNLPARINETRQPRSRARLARRIRRGGQPRASMIVPICVVVSIAKYSERGLSLQT